MPDALFLLVPEVNVVALLPLEQLIGIFMFELV